MKSGMRILLGASLIFGVSAASSPTPAAAQNPVQKVGTAISKGAKTTVHNVKHAGIKTKHAARSTGRATTNLVVGHKILCGDGTWASRDNPSCAGHAGVAVRQPANDKDKDKDKDKH